MIQSRHAYKIFQMQEWESLRVQGTFEGSPVDIKDGYIHLSSLEQVQGTLDKHYKGGVDVIIARITLEPLMENVKYEASRGGALFPHLYADLPLRSVETYNVFKPNSDSLYRFDPETLSEKV